MLAIYELKIRRWFADIGGFDASPARKVLDGGMRLTASSSILH